MAKFLKSFFAAILVLAVCSLIGMLSMEWIVFVGRLRFSNPVSFALAIGPIIVLTAGFIAWREVRRG